MLLISTLATHCLLSDGCEGYLAIVMNHIKEGAKLEEVPIVREYSDVFPEELLGLPLEREVEFVIELALGTEPISKAPY